MEKVYGIDKAVNRWAFEKMPVCLNTVKKWRRKDPATALQRLIEKAGSQKKLASMLGVAQRTISVWLSEDMPLAERPEKPARNEVERTVRANGGQPKVGADLGVTQQCVGNWCKLGYVPPGRAQEMEMLYGVPRIKLINPKLINALGAGEEL